MITHGSRASGKTERLAISYVSLWPTVEVIAQTCTVDFAFSVAVSKRNARSVPVEMYRGPMLDEFAGEPRLRGQTPDADMFAVALGCRS